MKKIKKSLRLNKEVITRLESASVQGGNKTVLDTGQFITDTCICPSNTCVTNTCVTNWCETKKCETNLCPPSWNCVTFGGTECMV